MKERFQHRLLDFLLLIIYLQTCVNFFKVRADNRNNETFTRESPSTVAEKRKVFADKSGETYSTVSRLDALTHSATSRHSCGMPHPTAAELTETARLISNAQQRSSASSRVFTANGISGIFHAEIRIKFTVFYRSDNTGYISEETLIHQFNIIKSRFTEVETTEPFTGTKETWNFIMDPSVWIVDNSMFANCGLRNGQRARRNVIDTRTYPTTVNIIICNICRPGIGGCEIGFASSFPNLDSNNCVKSYTNLIGCDAVFLDYRVLPGEYSFPSKDRGLVAVHELGHFFGLYHVFQSSEDCMGSGDLVRDTPFSKAPNFGCNIGADSCPSRVGLDAIRNYMDYSDDSCMFKSNDQYRETSAFTKGQMELAMERIVLNRPSMVQLKSVTLPNCSGLDLDCDESITVRVRTDGFGFETSWQIAKPDVCVTIGAAARSLDSDTLSETIIGGLCPGSYVFKISDSYGDGICCEEGAGFYQILDSSGVLVAGDGIFLVSQTQTFEIIDLPFNTVPPLDTPSPPETQPRPPRNLYS